MTGREPVRVGAVVVDVGPDQHKALQHAERKARTYGKALLGLASLLCLSVCGNLVCSALSFLVFKESRFSDATPPPPRSVVLSDSKAAAPVGTSSSYVGTGLSTYGLRDMVLTPFEALAYVKDTPADDTSPLVVSLASAPGVKRCAIAPSGTEACWELADPTMTDIPDDFLQGNTGLTGTLKVGPAVKTIGAWAFAYTTLTGLDLSEATSLVDIGEEAFRGTYLESTLVIPAKVTTICAYAFQATKLTGLDLSKATALVSIEDGAFAGTYLGGTLVIPAAVTTIGNSAFQDSMLTGIDLSEATSLVEIWNSAFYATDLEGTLVIPATVTTIGSSAFTNTKLTGLDLSDAAALVSIGDSAFSSTDLRGTLVIPASVKRIGDGAFYNTEAALDFSKATSLVEIKDDAFFGTTDLEGTLVTPTTVTMIGSHAFADTKLAELRELTDLDLSEATSLSIGASSSA